MTPRASAAEACGFDTAGRLAVRVTAPPVEGLANRAVIELLARLVRVARSSVRVVRGAASRTKTIEIDGVNAETLASCLVRKDRR